MNAEVKEPSKYEILQGRVRETPLPERLERAQSMIAKMCSEGRSPRMSIPVSHEDEDIFITTTLKDALEALKWVGTLEELEQQSK